MNVVSRVLVIAVCAAGSALALSSYRNCPCGKTGSAPPTSSVAAPASSSATADCCSEVTRLNLLTAASKDEAKGEAPVELRAVKLAGLLQEIKNQPGKLVVVDVWADFCIPCKKGFPHLVQMHKQFAKDGLVAMSVCVDELKDQEASLKFLKKQQATFPNFLLDEPTDHWQDHWNIKAIPAVFLYRDGKKIAQFDYDDPDNQFTYDDVEKAIVKLLGK
jgi:thiol-disulfide isomerase/thioredoxin